MRSHDRERWANEVYRTVCERVPPSSEITVFAGARYREYLVPLLEETGYRVLVPMKGMSIGKQLKWLDDQVRP